MRKCFLTIVLASIASAAWAQGFPGDFDDGGALTSYSVPVAREYIRCGDLRGQQMWFRPARGDAPAPLVLTIDDDYWRDRYRRNGQQPSDGHLPGFIYQHGFASVSIRSRAYPELKAAEAIADLAAAMARLREESIERGIDMSRLILVGRGSAAWAAALLAIDPSHIAATGIDFSAIKGVVLINGDGMDLPARATESPQLRSDYFDDFFGEGDEALARFSPAAHLDPPNAPAFLLLVEERRGSAQASARRFAERLSAASIAHGIVTIERHRSDSLTREIGASRSSSTPALERFMANAFGR